MRKIHPTTPHAQKIEQQTTTTTTTTKVEVSLSIDAKTTTMSAVVVLQRARTSGKCPPSLMSDDRLVVSEPPDGFEDAVVKVMDATGTSATWNTLFFCFRVL